MTGDSCKGLATYATYRCHLFIYIQQDKAPDSMAEKKRLTDVPLPGFI